MKSTPQAQLLCEKEVAALLNCSVFKLQRDRRVGSPIPFKKVGRSVKYSLADVESYLERQSFTSTSQYGVEVKNGK